MRCVQHADCYCFTMSYREVRSNFKCVSQSMTVIEECALPTFPFISRNNVCFDFSATRYPLNERQRCEVFARNEVIFRHLAETATHLAFWQCGQRIHLASHTMWLPESANEVFSFGNIDASLTADCGVDHCEKSRCNMNNCDTAVIRSSSKTCDIRNHATAHSDNNISSRKTCLSKFTAQFFNGGKRLMGLSISNDVMRHCISVKVREILRWNTNLRHNRHSFCALWQHRCNTRTCAMAYRN